MCIYSAKRLLVLPFSFNLWKTGSTGCSSPCSQYSYCLSSLNLVVSYSYVSRRLLCAISSISLKYQTGVKRTKERGGINSTGLFPGMCHGATTCNNRPHCVQGGFRLLFTRRGIQSFCLRSSLGLWLFLSGLALLK